MPGGTPCRVGHRAACDTMPGGYSAGGGTKSLPIAMQSAKRVRSRSMQSLSSAGCSRSHHRSPFRRAAIEFHTTCAARRVPHVVAPPCDACCMPPWFRWAPTAHPTVLHPSPRVTTGNRGSHVRHARRTAQQALHCDRAPRAAAAQRSGPAAPSAPSARLPPSRPAACAPGGSAAACT